MAGGETDAVDRDIDLDTRILRSADPERARATVDRIATDRPDHGARLVEDPGLAAAAVAVAAASRSLARLIETDHDSIEVLEALDERPVRPQADVEELIVWKRREFLRITARDLLGLDDLETATAALSLLARDFLTEAIEITGVPDLAVVGMGKLGGNELNYSSDIDLMFVGDGDPQETTAGVRRVIEITRRAFRVDTNLRPEGRSGSLVRTLDSYEAYWDRWAEPWEFQALLKARAVAGDPLLGRRFEDAAERWLWNQPFDADAIRSLRSMKQRTEEEVARADDGGNDIKRGPGGIRDIEFAVQLLQLVHGRLDPDVRSPNTLKVLGTLAADGYIDETDAGRLADAYRFLRGVEHRLQLVDEHQTHTVPFDEGAREHVARSHGFHSSPESTALATFDARLRSTQLSVRSIYDRVYFRPLLEAFAGTEGELGPAAAAERLAAFGFTDAKRTKAAVRELTRGMNRSSHLMKQFLPLMLDWLSRSPDPDLGLLMLRNLLDNELRRRQLSEAFRESPDVARRLCQVLGTSRLMGEVLTRNPDLVGRLPAQADLATGDRTGLIDSARAAVSWRDERLDRQEGLRRWKERHTLGISARDVLFGDDVATIGRDLTALAEASLDVALRAMSPTVPFAVVALGRLGGSALSYGSDLDVIFVYEGETPLDFEVAETLAKRLLKFVNGESPADRIFAVDAKLRPEGSQGAMARSVEGYDRYFDTWADVWERQAYIRARPVAGDPQLGRCLIEALEPHVWDGGLSAREIRDIRRTKARVENERLPAGEDPKYHLKLGRGSLSDIEWTTQLLQLTHGVRGTGTVEALRSLEASGRIAAEDADVLAETHEFLERTRNRLFLINSVAGDSLPTQPEPLTCLARSLGTDSAGLREEYRRLTRRTRNIVGRVFYGRA